MIFSNNIYRQINHFGLSISSNSIRATSTDKTKKITHQAEILSEKSFIEGDLVNQELLSSSLTELFTKLNSNTPYASVCLPEKLTYSRLHILPKLAINEIAEAVSWQLSTIFPLNPEDNYYDWRLLSQTEENTKIIVIAINKKLLDGIISSCAKAGIKPISFESSASVLSRAITPLPEYAVITEVDSLGSSSSLIETGVSSITTTTNYSSSTDSQTVIKDISKSIIQLIDRAGDNKDGKQKIAVYIAGEKSSASLAKIISDQVGQPITELIIEQATAAYQLSYIESLTQIELPESEKSINLLPEGLQGTYRIEAETTLARKIITWSAALSLLACITSIGLLIVASIISQQSNAKLAAIPELPTPPPEFNQQLLLQKAQKIIAFQNSKKIPIEALNMAIDIFSTYPVRQFDYNATKNEIKISLNSVSREDLFSIKANVEATNKFNQLTIPLSALGSEKAEAISLILQIKDK